MNSTHTLTASAPEEVLADDEIRRRAHQLWQQCGKPSGDDWAHWFAAKKQLQESLVTLSPPAAQKDFEGNAAFGKDAASGQHFHRSTENHDRRIDVSTSGRIQRRRARHAPRPDQPTPSASETARAG